LIRNKAPPLPGDRALVVRRVADAPFSAESHSAATWSAMGTDVVGAPHPSRPDEVIGPDTRLSACEAHVAKRIIDERWEAGTTTAEYVSDLHRAADHADARLHVGEKPPPDAATTRRFQRVAATLTRMGPTGPALTKAVKKPDHALFVVYDADKSALVTGYSEPEYVVHNLVKRWNNRRVVARGA
jgi:hypothetical protein